MNHTKWIEVSFKPKLVIFLNIYLLVAGSMLNILSEKELTFSVSVEGNIFHVLNKQQVRLQR